MRHLALFLAAAAVSGGLLVTSVRGQSRWKSQAATPLGVRVDAAMAYDPSSCSIVLYGGWDQKGSRFAHTWQWTGLGWKKHTEQSTGGPAQHRWSHELVYDPSIRSLVMFGGHGKINLWWNDTWVWSTAKLAWRRVQTHAAKGTNQPSPRASYATAYCPNRKRPVLFGGEYGCNNIYKLHRDTWLFDATKSIWNEWPKRGAVPAPRRSHAMVAFRGSVFMFGGAQETSITCTPWKRVGTSYRDDAWRWTGQGWVNVTRSSPWPPRRAFHKMVHDRARDVVVMYGGLNHSGNLGDTWEWDGARWQEVKMSGPPKPYQYAFAYDDARCLTQLYDGAGRNLWTYAPSVYRTEQTGCKAPNGGVPALSMTAPPRLGTKPHLLVSNCPRSAPAVLMFAHTDKTWGTIKLPIRWQGCPIYVPPLVPLPTVADSSGTARVPFILPNDPALSGLWFFNQAWVLDAKANRWATSNLGKGVLGY